MTNRLTEDQIGDYKEAFTMFNKDGSGYIGADEVGKILRSFAQNQSKDEIYEMIDQVDANGDGLIDVPEFLELVGRLHEAKEGIQETINAFKVFDRDGSGLIAESEARYVLARLEEGMTEQEIDEMMKYADVGQDGYLDYRDFAKALSTAD